VASRPTFVCPLPGCHNEIRWTESIQSKGTPAPDCVRCGCRVGLLAGAIVLLIASLGQRQHLYQGRPQYYWSQQINSLNPALSNEAALVLNQEIIPRLKKIMFEDTNDSSLRIALIDKLNGLPAVNIFFQTADGRRAAAAGGPGDFGAAAHAAIPALLQAVQSQDRAVRGPAAVSLGKIHAKPEVVIPLLITYLDQEELRESAAEALGEFGGRSKAAIPKLLILFKVRDKSLHHTVEEALRKIDPDAAAQAGVRLGPSTAPLSKSGAP